jgi:hypothetical protein
MKILIVVSSSFHLRSVIDSGLLINLCSKFEVTLATNVELEQNLEPVNLKRCMFRTSPQNSKFTGYIMDSGTWRFRSKSSSFRYRIKRRLYGDTSHNNFDFIQKLKFKYRFMISLTKYFLLGNILSYWALRNIYRILQRNEQSVANVLKIQNPDLVIVWAQTLDPASSAFLYHSRKNSIPSLMIADNWDNLFSKTVFPISPNYVGCFGAQSADFGSKLHGIPRNRFLLVGSARFDVYREFSKIEDRKIILFAGSSMPEDDEKIVTLIDEVRAQRKNVFEFDQFTWRYRPHPVPQYVVSDFQDLFPSFDFTDNRSNSAEIAWPSLQDSVTELANTRVAVCMPTSYLLEALACEVPVIIPAFLNMNGLTSSRVLMESLAHLKNVHELPGVFVATSEEDFKRQLNKLIESDLRIKLSEKLDYFVEFSKNSFADNLISAISTVINGKERNTRNQG